MVLGGGSVGDGCCDPGKVRKGEEVVLGGEEVKGGASLVGGAARGRAGAMLL